MRVRSSRTIRSGTACALSSGTCKQTWNARDDYDCVERGREIVIASWIRRPRPDAIRVLCIVAMSPRPRRGVDTVITVYLRAITYECVCVCVCVRVCVRARERETQKQNDEENYGKWGEGECAARVDREEREVAAAEERDESAARADAF